MNDRLKAPWTADDFYALKWIDDARLSPDGKKVVFVRRDVDRQNNRYVSSLWLVKTAGGRPRRLTYGGKSGDSQPTWSPDGRRIAFTSARYGPPQIYEIELSGGEARPVTDLYQGAHSPAYSPDGKRIAFLSNVNEDERVEATRKPKPAGEKEIEKRRKADDGKAEEARDPRICERLLYRTGRIWREGRWDHVFVIDRKGNRPALSLTSGDFDHTRPVWHPDGNSVFTTSERTGEPGHEEVYDVLRLPLDGAEPEFVIKTTCVTGFDLSPDGSKMAYTSVPAVNYYAHPVLAKVRDLASGEEVVLTADLDADVSQPRFGKGGAEVLFTAPLQGDVELWSAPADGSGAPAALIRGKRMIQAYDVCPATGDLTFTATAPEIPGDLFIAPQGGPERRITALCKDLIARRHMSLPDEIRFKGHDGLEIQGWIMKSRGFEEGKPERFALEIHGGPHIMWGNEFWHEFQVLASAGYTVLFSNPRGSNGYGLDFKKVLYRNWGVDDSKDLLAGVDEMVKRGLADPDRLYVTGGSYGGFMTAWLVTHDTRFKAAVAQRGVYNLLSMYNGSDAQCLLDWEFDTAPWDDPMLLVKHSPVHYADRVTTPTMVMHADCDFTATIPSAEEFFNALQRNKVDSVFVRYPREGHELSRSGEPDHRVDRITRILGWFEEH